MNGCLSIIRHYTLLLNIVNWSPYESQKQNMLIPRDFLKFKYNKSNSGLFYELLSITSYKELKNNLLH